MDSKVVSFELVEGMPALALRTSHPTTKSAKSHGVDSRACGGGTCAYLTREGFCKRPGTFACTPVVDGEHVALYFKRHYTAAQVAAHLRQVEHTPTE